MATSGNPINKGIWEVHANKAEITKTITPTVPTKNNWVDSLKNGSKFSFAIYHPFAKAAYREADEKIVKEVIQLLKDHADYQLQIVSATDCKGSQEYNQALSKRRARYVLNRLPKVIQAKAIMRWVSKNEPKEPCEQSNAYDETAQQINRYTYLLVSDSK
jgi:outer membrane protein OmpA-like peptidoglycan-associated protein